MSYRYNSLDVIVGVGMCAIMFGALLIFVSASGAFLPAAPQSVPVEGFSGASLDMAWLQPALGQAIVERILLQRRTDDITRAATAEWNQAMLAYRSLHAVPEGPLGSVLHRAETVPMEHEARVQGLMGRSIVNFTRRGVRSGVLSADQYLSDYNSRMIGATESTGQRLSRQFASSWQVMLGQSIVDASRTYAAREAAVQEQLGSAIIRVTQAKTVLEDAWSANQYQLGALMVALDRSGIGRDRMVSFAAADVKPRGPSVAATVPMSWPDIPMGILFAVSIGLCMIFFGGLTLAGSYREAKALAEARRNSARWVYRMAA